MHQLFLPYVSNILNQTKPKNILEVGVCHGETTKKLLKWCHHNNANLTSLDPAAWEGELPEKIKPPYQNYVFKKGHQSEMVSYTPKKVVEIFEEKLDSNWDCKKITSLDYLKDKPEVHYNTYILDGDHNYYTVYSELNLIKNYMKSGDIVLFHDVSDKWHRKDLYYDIRNIPVEFRNTEKQGVMTAIDEFLQENNGHKTGELCLLEDIEHIISSYTKNSNTLEKAKTLARIAKNLFKTKSSRRVSKEITKLTSKILDSPLYCSHSKSFRFQIITRKHFGLGLLEKI